MAERIIRLTEGYMRHQPKGFGLTSGERKSHGYSPRPKSEIAPPPAPRPQSQKIVAVSGLSQASRRKPKG